MKRALVLAVALSAAANAQGAKPAAAKDTAARPVDGLIPAGYGTLRQEQIAIRLQINGLTVSATPLDESVIRTLAPDSYQTFHAMRESKSKQLEALRARNGFQSVQAWLVQYFNVKQGDARFDAFDFLVRSAGQDYRPLDALPLTPAFGEGRVAQGKHQDAIYMFDGQIQLNQPITVTALGQQSTAWADNVLPLVERERTLIWSRAPAAKP